MDEFSKETIISELTLLKNIGAILLEKVPKLEKDYTRHLDHLENKVKNGRYDRRKK